MRRKAVKRLESIYVQQDVGRNNANIEAARERLIRGQTYRDLSTICIVPIIAKDEQGNPVNGIPHNVVQPWMNLATPMNQKFLRLFVPDKEVGDAYNQAVQMILDNAELSKWKYILTLETDNCPAPDGLLKLYEGIQKFDAVGGLYWVKGENGHPMIYGDPKVMPKNFIPQLPQVDTIQECNGLGMGFTLFKLDMFKKVPKPWFRTLQEYVPNQGMRAATQDLYFFQEASKYGFRFACDTRCRVGHWDNQNQMMW